MMLVDEIFALYLWTISKKVKDEFFVDTMLPYVMLFRECLNEIGWQKKAESEQQNGNADGESKTGGVDAERTGDFCINNNAEHAPEICNEFVTVYLENKKTQIQISKPD